MDTWDSIVFFAVAVVLALGCFYIGKCFAEDERKRKGK